MFARHDLVFIDSQARAVLSADVPNRAFWPDDQVEKLLHKGYDGVFVPGIVTRQPKEARGLVVGFSAPFRKEGMRLRAAATIDARDVTAVVGPYEVSALAADADSNESPVFSALHEAIRAARDCQLACGVFGSCALALATGLPYFHDASDLDLVVGLSDRSRLEAFSNAVNVIASSGGVRTDVEVELPGGWGIKLAELLDDGSTVLAKGFTDVRLFPKEEVLAMNIDFVPCERRKNNGSQV